MTSPDQLPFFDIYIDESSQTRHRFLVLGGIVIRTDRVAQFTHALAAVRQPELPAAELKWSKVSRAKLAAYKRVVDLFFAPQYAAGPHFHSVIIDTPQQNHRAYNEGSRDIGFNKELYQLCLKCGRLYPGLFHVYPDYRRTNQHPEKLRTMLNFGIRKGGDVRDWPYRRMQFRDSKDAPLLQMTDILSGAIAYRLNDHHLALDASPAKIELSAYILDKARISNVLHDSARRGKFTLWHRQLRKGIPRP